MPLPISSTAAARNMEALNKPSPSPALAARQLSAAESRNLSTNSAMAARNMETLANTQNFEPPPPPPSPSMLSQLGTGALGLGKLGGSLALGAGKNFLNSVTGGAGGDLLGAAKKLAGGDIGGAMSSMSGALSKAAGVPGNPTSEKRAENIPAGGEVFTSTTEQTKVKASSGDDWRVKISAPWSLLQGSMDPFLSRLKKTNGVVFPYLPTITISTSANYNQTNFTHNNYPFNAYQNSVVDDITITGSFSCETPEDAEYWLATTLFFRGATKMFFGNSKEVGNPPIICKLNGYGSYVFNDVSVIIKNFNVILPPDVDYILYQGQAPNAQAKASAWDSRASRDAIAAHNASTSTEKTWVPILSDISVTVSPIYSREKIRKFNLQDFASGNIAATKGFM